MRSNMASYREGRPRTSIAWDHFEIKDKERGVATCNICHEAFSYRTSVSNLMKHLKNKHGYVVVKGEDDGNEEMDFESETSVDKGEGKKFKKELWEYYEVKDEEKKLATCTMCLDQFSYEDNTPNLYKHLLVKHSIDFGKGSDEEILDDDLDREKPNVGIHVEHITHETRGRNKSSVAWEYFEIKDDDRKVASCNLCGALCSYRTSVSNLMKHARRKHGVAEGEDDDDNIRLDDALDSTQDGISFRENKLETSGRSQRSIVWLYFKPVDNESKVSQCLICKKTFSHSSTLTNLKKHLARKHPNVKIPHREDGRKRILLSSGGELFEVETGTKLEDDDDHNNSTMQLDTVYLEDFDLQDDEPLKKPKLPTSPNPKKRRYSSSSEEEITFINRYVRKPSDSFDHFGKYIASLLRNLPRETSSKLQADFIQQIMCTEKETVKSNVFGVTDTGSSQQFLVQEQ